MASAVALALELLPCRKSQLGAQFSPTFHSTSTEMYTCVNFGKVLRSQQGLNYHLAQKPTTCEKYLRKLSNQEKQASMVTQTAAAKSAVGNAAATQTGAASLSLAAKSALGNETPDAPDTAELAGETLLLPVRTPARNNLLSLQKCSESRKLLAGEAVHKTMFDTDGYCWYAETGSAKKGRFYESCRCCSMYHSSDPLNVVAHIRTSKEMKCKCALNAPCKCKYGPQPPLFVVGRCTGKRIRRTRRGVSSGERALHEERDSHDSSFCKMNKVQMVAAVNKANMKAKARTVQSCQHLKAWQVRQAIGADHQIPYKLVGERAVERLFSSARKANKSLLYHVDSASPVFKQLLSIPEFRCVNIEPCGESEGHADGMHAEFLFMPHASNEVLCSSAGEVVAVDATFCSHRWPTATCLRRQCNRLCHTRCH